MSSQEQAQAWLDQQWEEEVVRRLPADLEKQAAQLQSYQRVRQIKSAADLLRARFSYVLCAPSFRRIASLGGAHWLGQYLRTGLAQPTASGQ